MRRGQTPLNAAFRNPTVIGALAVLITVLTVFLAYNANNGLPFVQSYRLTAQVPNAAALVPGNEVRVGGVRVGVVESIKPVAEDDGTFAAALEMKLDKSVEPLPEDSTVIIRSRSALGLKYVQIVRGTSDQGYPAGSTLPLSSATPEPVEFDQLLSTFDEPTQENIKTNLTEFGNALAGRGPDINEAIGALKPLLPRLERVMRDISDPQTGIGPFFTALARTLPPGRPGRGDAGADVRRPRHDAGGLRRHRPALPAGHDLEDAGHPASDQRGPADRAAVPRQLAEAVRQPPARRQGGRRVRGRDRIGARHRDPGPPRFARVQQPAAADRRVAEAVQRRHTRSAQGLTDVTDLSESLGPLLKFVAPAQSVCNYATLLFRNAASATSQGNPNGNWTARQRERHSRRPQQRGQPVDRPRRTAAGPIRGTSCTSTPTRTPPLPARARVSARRATSPTSPDRPRSATPPATRES